MWRTDTSGRCQLSDDHSSVQLSRGIAGLRDTAGPEAGDDVGPEAGGVSGGTAGPEPGVVFMSDGASVHCGHSVSFLIHYSDDAGPEAGPEAGSDAGPEAGPGSATAGDAGPEAGIRTGPEAGITRRGLMLSERDGVGLSVSDDVNINSDDVIFYSFHGT